MATTPRSVRTRPSIQTISSSHLASSTPLASAMVNDIEVGDTVNVPGGMEGTVKFLGEVRGRQGKYIGVELDKKWASRGKNNGEAEGLRYFTTSIPGAGIFLPIERATRRASPPNTPTTSIDALQIPDSTPTPHKFNQSLGAGGLGRASSPAFRPKSRPSLPRPESPLRKAPSTPGGRPSFTTPAQNRVPGARFAPSPTPKVQGRPPLSKVEGEGDEATKLRNRVIEKDDIIRKKDETIREKEETIREKNEKIASLTAEFDSHRADFRSTLDTLETASSETERVYETRIDELLEERRVWVAQSEDVESVADQLKQLEEVVQELEDGLEDARRGEAEARGEVEYLRGEIERERAEHSIEHCGICGGRHSESDCLKRAPRFGEYEYNDGSKYSLDADTHEYLPRQPSAPGNDKWCALCEETGHDSISCPNEQ
ncbi:hypothetical protein MMC06_002500 [Schaereria dolodes]|nr:hypothetical protein [Schaereria dolodes]